MGSLLFTDEHLPCYNYDKQARPMVQFTEFVKDQTIEGEMLCCRIIFIVSGAVRYALNHEKPTPIKGGYMLFVPANIHLNFTALESSRVVVMYLENLLEICECFDDEDDKLYNDEMRETPPGIMEIHPRIRLFLDTFGVYIQDGMRCKSYIRTKIKELYYYIRAYYEKTRITMFFSLLNAEDREFSDKIIKNWRQFKTTKQMIAFMNSSRTPFERKFLSVFGQKPNEWLKNKRKEAIFEDLTCTDEPFKILAGKHLFPNQTSFSDYCRYNFKMSPIEIRENKGRKKYVQ